jgi:transcriptional regulator NrdR family protein
MKRSTRTAPVGLGCPKCQRGSSAVLDSRDSLSGKCRRRRHECVNCGERFTTYEITAAEYERVKAIRIDVSKLSATIATLRALKAQFGDSNGHSNHVKN